MEAHSLPGGINVSASVAGRVKALFELESRGSVEVKHERAYEMFFLNRLKQEYSRDRTGNLPNENLRLAYGA
jgi:adenylate cyclase